MNDMLTVNFMNSGTIAPEIINRINMPSEETNTSGNIKTLHTGLGLLIVKKILALHDYNLHAACNNETVTITIQMSNNNPALLS